MNHTHKQRQKIFKDIDRKFNKLSETLFFKKNQKISLSHESFCNTTKWNLKVKNWTNFTPTKIEYYFKIWHSFTHISI